MPYPRNSALLDDRGRVLAFVLQRDLVRFAEVELRPFNRVFLRIDDLQIPRAGRFCSGKLDIHAFVVLQDVLPHDILLPLVDVTRRHVDFLDRQAGLVDQLEVELVVLRCVQGDGGENDDGKTSDSRSCLNPIGSHESPDRSQAPSGAEDRHCENSACRKERWLTVIVSRPESY